MLEEVFSIVQSYKLKVPILLSSPHSGVSFPDELKNQFIKDKMRRPDDADWFIHELYDFAPQMGITMIHANYCRWVIDLNRDPESKPLYDDGRIITALCPSTDFFGNPIYKDRVFEPDDDEVTRRKKLYFDPYHLQLKKILNELKKEFGFALLFDAHSIRKKVDTISSEPFPDYILGTNDGVTASDNIIKAVKRVFVDEDFAYNRPFKGGYITRSLGDPGNGIHAIQLEMAKTNYMDDDEVNYHPTRAERTRNILKQLFNNIIEAI